MVGFDTSVIRAVALTPFPSTNAATTWTRLAGLNLFMDGIILERSGIVKYTPPTADTGLYPLPWAWYDQKTKNRQMADDREILEFVIQDSHTPATLPMASLAEYLADLAIVLGERQHVHFVELKEGSSAIRHTVDTPAVQKVRARIHAAKVGDADSEASSAMDRIEHRLRADNARAVLRKQGDEQGRLLYFPGVSSPVEPEYGPFNEQAQLYGVPISVGGKRALVKVHLEDGDKVHICDASRDVALRIAPLMFHHHVRVHGTGRFFRDSDGNWEMRSFRIADFEKLDARPLAETVERLRSITRKVGLDKDILKKLADLRREPSEA